MALEIYCVLSSFESIIKFFRTRGFRQESWLAENASAIDILPKIAYHLMHNGDHDGIAVGVGPFQGRGVGMGYYQIKNHATSWDNAYSLLNKVIIIVPYKFNFHR